MGCRKLSLFLWPLGVRRHVPTHLNAQMNGRLRAKALAMRGSSRRCRFLSGEHLQLGVSHVVEMTLGPHAYRIGGGGAWISI